MVDFVVIKDNNGDPPNLVNGGRKMVEGKNSNHHYIDATKHGIFELCSLDYGGSKTVTNFPKEVYFAYDEAADGLSMAKVDVINGDEERKLLKQRDGEFRKVAENIIDFPYSRLNVIGHTDNTGADEYNQNLSEARATYAVREILEDVEEIITEQVREELKDNKLNEAQISSKIQERVKAVEDRIDISKTGKGEYDQKIEYNQDTKELQNRRVQFIFDKLGNLDSVDKPTEYTIRFSPGNGQDRDGRGITLTNKSDKKMKELQQAIDDGATPADNVTSAKVNLIIDANDDNFNSIFEVNIDNIGEYYSGEYSEYVNPKKTAEAVHKTSIDIEAKDGYSYAAVTDGNSPITNIYEISPIGERALIGKVRIHIDPYRPNQDISQKSGVEVNGKTPYSAVSNRYKMLIINKDKELIEDHNKYNYVGPTNLDIHLVSSTGEKFRLTSSNKITPVKVSGKAAASPFVANSSAKAADILEQRSEKENPSEVGAKTDVSANKDVPDIENAEIIPTANVVEDSSNDVLPVEAGAVKVLAENTGQIEADNEELTTEVKADEVVHSQAVSGEVATNEIVANPLEELQKQKEAIEAENATLQQKAEKYEELISSGAIEPNLADTPDGRSEVISKLANERISQSNNHQDIQQDGCAEVQRILENKGYSVGSCGVDGLMGKDTFVALEQYVKERSVNFDNLSETEKKEFTSLQELYECTCEIKEKYKDEGNIVQVFRKVRVDSEFSMGTEKASLSLLSGSVLQAEIDSYNSREDFGEITNIDIKELDKSLILNDKKLKNLNVKIEDLKAKKAKIDEVVDAIEDVEADGLSQEGQGNLDVVKQWIREDVESNTEFDQIFQSMSKEDVNLLKTAGITINEGQVNVPLMDGDSSKTKTN